MCLIIDSISLIVKIYSNSAFLLVSTLAGCIFLSSSLIQIFKYQQLSLRNLLMISSPYRYAVGSQAKSHFYSDVCFCQSEKNLPILLASNTLNEFSFSLFLLLILYLHFISLFPSLSLLFLFFSFLEI
jgi:hypothetical protein